MAKLTKWQTEIVIPRPSQAFQLQLIFQIFKIYEDCD